MTQNIKTRFCANLKWLFTEQPFLDRFAAASKAGFEAVEYASPYEYPATELRSRLNDNGLKQVLINTPVGAPGTATASGSACLKGYEEQSRTDLKRAFEYASALDCPLVHLMAGILPQGEDRDEAFKRYVDHVAWAAELAHDANIKLVLEALNQRDVPGFIIQTQEQSASVVQTVGSEHVGLLFDIYHCQVSQGDIATRLKALMPLIAHVQVADPPLRCEPGLGEINWDYVFKQLLELGYDGWIGCEYRPFNGTEAGLGWRTRFV
jgi:hydroxypyruvate isomerase